VILRAEPCARLINTIFQDHTYPVQEIDMQDQQHDIQDIIDGINDAQNVLSSKYIDDQIRTFYESELAHYKSLMHLVVHGDISA